MTDPRSEAFMIAVLLALAEERTPEQRQAWADKVAEAGADNPNSPHAKVCDELRSIARLIYRYPRLEL